jgi:hypothetical protein
MPEKGAATVGDTEVRNAGSVNRNHSLESDMFGSQDAQ